MNNVRNLTALIVLVPDLPKTDGASAILWLTHVGEIEGEDNLRILFCPGDAEESFPGADAYRDIDPRRKGSGP